MQGESWFDGVCLGGVRHYICYMSVRVVSLSLSLVVSLALSLSASYGGDADRTYSYKYVFFLVWFCVFYYHSSKDLLWSTLIGRHESKRSFT